MPELLVSAPFRNFLEDYAKKVGKSPTVIVEEAVSQAIGRHSVPDTPAPEEARVLMPGALQKRLVGMVPGVETATSTETRFGEFFEHLPDLAWTYQICRFDDWWFLVVSKEPVILPDEVEEKYVETNQAYCWTYGYAKTVRLWSAPDRFLLVF